MSLATMMLMLAIGSFLFGLLLVVLKFMGSNRQEVPFWIVAKFHQAIGSLILFFRGGTYDTVSMLANTALLLGLAYEAWAVRILAGQPSKVKRRVHILISGAIIVVGVSTLSMVPPYLNGVVFLVQSIFMFLPSVFLLKDRKSKSPLQLLLGACYSIGGTILLLVAVLCLVFPQTALSFGIRPLFMIMPITSYCVFLLSGYIMLMLAKERSDQQVSQIQKNLEKTEIQFQRVVETAFEGIVMFDKNFKITFANEQMASMLGYRIDELVGKSYSSLFPENHLDINHKQEALRKKGHNSVYECCLLGKDGQEHWFLISATAIMNDSGMFAGSFAMLTDMTERKKIELALEETNRKLLDLSNMDSLTGIANRRCFYDTLTREYSKLKRTKSKLSIVMFDIDYFKNYNDHYGHVMGDVCLRQIGGVAVECVREIVDLAARYGGEEFACILPDSDIATAVKVAERIQQKIMDLKIEHKKSPVSQYVTASFGVTTVQYQPNQSVEEVVNIADKLLYKAKESGRNRIEVAEWE